MTEKFTHVRILRESEGMDDYIIHESFHKGDVVAVASVRSSYSTLANMYESINSERFPFPWAFGVQSPDNGVAYEFIKLPLYAGRDCCVRPSLMSAWTQEPTYVPSPDNYDIKSVTPGASAPNVPSANPKKAYGDAKLPVQLVPPALLLGAARALGEGAAKYGPYNWRDTNVEAMTYIGAIGRHMAAYLDGEDVDPESVTGKTHLEGVAACIAILLDAAAMNSLIDNRPPKGPGAALSRRLMEKKT